MYQARDLCIAHSKMKGELGATGSKRFRIGRERTLGSEAEQEQIGAVAKVKLDLRTVWNKVDVAWDDSPPMWNACDSALKGGRD